MLKKAALLTALVALSACASNIPVIVQQDVSSIRPLGVSTAVDSPSGKTIKKIEERNRVIENDPEWIEQAYRKLNIRSLNTIAEKQYDDYKKYLDEGGTVYVIVHPAYFSFFHYRDLPHRVAQEGIGTPEDNVVDKLLSLPPPNIKVSLLQAQERRMRDFMEYMTTEKKLIVLVLPKKYDKFRGYIYKGGKDEYMRYLNEVTNETDSVVYVESRSPTRGYLYEEDLTRLMEFFLSIGAKRILVGGGYIGRCLEGFYIDFTEEFGDESTYMVPELSDVSPKDLSYSRAASLLNKDGTINVRNATLNLLADVYKIQEIRPRTFNLGIGPVDE